MAWFWLSFVDSTRPKGSQFLGVAIVEGKDFLTAVKAAHVYGCNPGGEVQGFEVPDHLSVPKALTDRLLSRAEAEAIDPESWAVGSSPPSSG